MASYLVLFNRGLQQSRFNNGKKTEVITATEAKKDEHLLGAAAISITGPLYEYNAIEIDAENEQSAAGAAVRVLGASEQENEFTVIPVASLVKKKGRS